MITASITRISLINKVNDRIHSYTRDFFLTDVSTSDTAFEAGHAAHIPHLSIAIVSKLARRKSDFPDGAFSNSLRMTGHTVEYRNTEYSVRK